MENRDQWGNMEQQEDRIQPENERPENKEYQFIREKVMSRRKKKLKRMGMSLVFTVFLAIVFGVVARAVFLYADRPLRRIMGMEEDPETLASAPSPTPALPATPTERPSNSANPAATETPDKDGETPMQSEAMGDGEEGADATGIPGQPGATGEPSQADPSHSGDSDALTIPEQGNLPKNPDADGTDTNQEAIPGNPDEFSQEGSGLNASENKNPGQTGPGQDGAEGDPSGKKESEDQESGKEGLEDKENSDSKEDNSSGDSSGPETLDGENQEEIAPSDLPQDGDAEGSGDDKEDGREGSFLGYAAMFAELREIADQAEKSLITVTVSVTGIDWLNDPYEAVSYTTGVIIEKTAEHLLVLLSLDRIQSASSIELAIGGESFEAELWNYDKDYNLAVVAVESSRIPERYWNQVQVAEWGDSASLAAGMPILALGNPNGYVGSMEFGMVTSSGSTYYIMDNSVALFNTNTTDSESGDGVIVSLEGKIIGLITRTMKSDLNVSMCTAVGISNLKNVIAKLAAGEKLISFGILGEDIPASVLKEEGIGNGIYVMEVIAESPAFEAGIKTGDIILRVEDTEVHSYSEFNTLLNLHKKGDSIRVTIRRMVRMNPQEVVLRAVLETK